MTTSRVPLPNSQMTIAWENETLIVYYEKLGQSRLTWVAPGLDVFLLNLPSGDTLIYESAGNLAMNECIGRHIPVSSLHAQIKRPRKSKGRYSDPDKPSTKDLFGSDAREVSDNDVL